MRKLRMLNVFPPMECDRGCGACCGPAPATEAEYQKAITVAARKGIEPKVQGLTCPFYQEGTCQIYDARPFACQLFGHTEGLECERGHNVNVAPEVVRKLMLKQGRTTRVLHEVLIETGRVESLEVLFDEALRAKGMSLGRAEP